MTSEQKGVDGLDECPRCDMCGAEITTGLMAVFCPRREKCEFYPEDADSQAFVAQLRGDFHNPTEIQP